MGAALRKHTRRCSRAQCLPRAYFSALVAPQLKWRRRNWRAARGLTAGYSRATHFPQDAYSTASEYEQKFKKHEKEAKEQVAQKDGAIAEKEKQIAELSAKVKTSPFTIVCSSCCLWPPPDARLVPTPSDRERRGGGEEARWRGFEGRRIRVRRR